MDFFQQQAKVRGRSRGLLLLFLLAVAGIVGAIDLVVVVALNFARNPHDPPLPLQTVLAGSSVLVLAVIALSTLYRVVSLSGGGASVAQELGGTLVSPDTHNPAHRRLRNVVEEIAIASGVAVPQVFVLEQETGINAFAAGYSAADAAVTVTRGALDKLSRDELQGVIAHEFSHLLNGDMRLNIRLMGLLFGILVLGVIGGKVLQYGPRGGDRKGGAAIFFIALGLFAVGYIGVFFGRLIKAGVSRQREYLADASAVQFTRQSEGIAGALKKLAGVNEGSKLTNAHGEEVAHMLFGDGMNYSALFATHPPLLKRIQAVEPNFNPAQLGELSRQWNDPGYVPQDEERPLLADFAGGPGTAAGGASGPAQGAALSVVPAAMRASVAQPQSAHYDCAAALRQGLPPALLAAAHDQEQAIDLVLGLLLDSAPGAVRDSQLQAIAEAFGTPHSQAAAALGLALAALHPAQRLPLAAIAAPSLRRQPRDTLIKLVRTVETLIQADGQVAVFEYCLGRVLSQNIVEALRPAQTAPPGRGKLADAAAEITRLLSVVAAFGQDDTASARRAFLIGTQNLPLGPSPAYQPLDPASWTSGLNLALRKLDALEPPAKALLLEGLSATIGADGKVTVEEAELLRAVCASLHCPLPPVLADAA